MNLVHCHDILENQNVVFISYSKCEQQAFSSNYHLEFRIIILTLAVIMKNYLALRCLAARGRCKINSKISVYNVKGLQVDMSKCIAESRSFPFHYSLPRLLLLVMDSYQRRNLFNSKISEQLQVTVKALESNTNVEVVNQWE